MGQVNWSVNEWVDLPSVQPPGCRINRYLKFDELASHECLVVLDRSTELWELVAGYDAGFEGVLLEEWHILPNFVQHHTWNQYYKQTNCSSPKPNFGEFYLSLASRVLQLPVSSTKNCPVLFVCFCPVAGANLPGSDYSPSCLGVFQLLAQFYVLTQKVTKY